MSKQFNRWFPKEGDLVAVPALRAKVPGVVGNCSYGIVVRESPQSEFAGCWWDIYFDGVLETLHIQTITPLQDWEGECLARSALDK